jgi:hypothetical protein
MSKLKYPVKLFIEKLVETDSNENSLLLAAIITHATTTATVSDRNHFLMRMYYNWLHILDEDALGRTFRAPEFQEKGDDT